jgi:hypothetical protein
MKASDCKIHVDDAAAAAAAAAKSRPSGGGGRLLNLENSHLI